FSAYSVPRPPSKTTTFTVLLSLTPNGLSALLAPPPVSVLVPPPPAQAARKPPTGVASRPAAPARRRRLRRDRSDELISRESDIRTLLGSGQAVRRIRPA